MLFRDPAYGNTVFALCRLKDMPSRLLCSIHYLCPSRQWSGVYCVGYIVYHNAQGLRAKTHLMRVLVSDVSYGLYIRSACLWWTLNWDRSSARVICLGCLRTLMHCWSQASVRMQTVYSIAWVMSLCCSISHFARRCMNHRVVYLGWKPVCCSTVCQLYGLFNSTHKGDCYH